MTSLANVFDNGRFRGWQYFDRMSETPDGRANRLDVLRNALEMLTLSESDYAELFYGARGNDEYVDSVADLLALPGVCEFFREFRRSQLSDSQKRTWLAGFVDGIGTFRHLLGFTVPVKTKRERFSSVLS